MHKRVRLRKKIILIPKKIHFKKSTIFVMVVVALLLFIMIMFKFINNKVTPILLNYAELELKKFSTLIINRAISKQITDDLNIDDLFLITKTDDGEIKSIDFNPIIVNKLLTLITSSVHLNLKSVEQGNLELLDIPDNVLIDYDKDKLKKGVIFEIPSGVVFSNSLLSNLGPKIPVKLDLIGDIISNVDTKVTNYGINNALIEVSINMEVAEQVILPFASKQVIVETNIPVAIKIIQGNIPNYYFNGIQQSSPNFSIPIE